MSIGGIWGEKPCSIHLDYDQSDILRILGDVPEFDEITDEMWDAMWEKLEESDIRDLAIRAVEERVWEIWEEMKATGEEGKE